MDIKYELLANIINTVVREKIELAVENLEGQANALAMVLLFEIKQIINDKEITDSDKIEKISEVYTKINADFDIHCVSD